MNNEKQPNAKSKDHDQAERQEEEDKSGLFWPHNSTNSTYSSTGDIRKKHLSATELSYHEMSTSSNERQHIAPSEIDYSSTSSFSSHHHHHHGNTDGHSSFQYYYRPVPPATTHPPSYTNPTSYNPHQSYNHSVETDSRNSSTGIQQSGRADTLKRDHKASLAQDPQENHRKDDEYRQIHQNGCPSSTSSQIPIAFYASRGYDYQYQSHRDQKNAKQYDYNTVVNSRRRNISPADLNTFNDDYHDSNYKLSSHAEEKEVTSAAQSDTPKATNQKQKEAKKTETQKKKKRKKSKDAPKRPLSAYNIFFKEERQRMLQSLPSMDNGPTSNSSSKCSRHHRKGRDQPHGKISFENLAKTIGSRWRELGSAERKKFEILAAKDTERYTEEMKVFHDEQMLKASTISSNDHSHEDSDEKVVLSSSKQRTTNDEYDSSAKHDDEHREETKSGAAALEEGEIEPVPFDSIFLSPSPFGCDDTNRSWSLKDYSFDSLDSKKAGYW
ncbi:hypothetical protein CTEN210_10049 [Chaetoceros tenuissimus]|uniref:HMG box domain-containing protein n=1 Tax=Chaetoceros tenuissimus TaxID=426638 RepID=A0AAD3CWQ6_9STRA|nr:hypothetical protein CTEN210_10049 [Chaetoceros tenuissimus]